MANTRTLSTGSVSALALVLLLNIPPAVFGQNNNTVDTAFFLRNGEIVEEGGFGAAGGLNFFEVRRVTAGDLIFVYVDTRFAADSQNSVLQVIANDGSTIIEQDNDSGPGIRSAIGGAVAPQDGKIFYRVSESGNDESMNLYALFHAVIAPTDAVSELEGNDSAATANGIPARVVNASVSGPDVDFFKFRADGSAIIVVIMDDDPDNDTNLTDTELDILDTDGVSVLTDGAGDNNGLEDGNAAGFAFAPSTGTYFVRVGNGGNGSDSSYRFVVLVNGVAFVDTDGDGFADELDNCPTDSNAAQIDADGDGFGDSCDECPASFIKQAPGTCGCNQPDVDINLDGVADCDLLDPALAMLSGPGLLLIPDAANKRVMAFDPANGDVIDPNFVPSDPANLSLPTAAILSADDNLILVSETTDDLVQAYDLAGDYQGVFAPAGGVDTAIIQNPRGMTLREDGSLLLAIGFGGNADSIIQLDSAGNFLNQFVAAGAGGLNDPFDVLIRGTDLFVSGFNSEAIHRYNADTGEFLNDFAQLDGRPEQISDSTNGHLLVGVTDGNQRGILEFDADGNLLNHISPSGFGRMRAAFELGNGNILTTPDEGVFEIDREENVIETKIRGLGLRYIKFVLRDADNDGVGDDLDGCPDDPAKTTPGVCGCGVADTDTDADGIADCVDNCVDVPNSDQIDGDADGQGDACEPPPPPCGLCGGGTIPLLPTMTIFMWRARRRRLSAASSETTL